MPSRDAKTIIQRVLIPAPPEAVYDAFMDSGKHSTFTGSRATCDPWVGGEISAWDGYISGKNLELVEGQKIVQEWRTTEWEDDTPSSTVTFSFEKKGAGTKLSMKHENVPAEHAAALKQGWIDFYWKPLKEYFEKR